MMCHSRLGAVWVLLAAAAAVELYDELAPELDGEFAYKNVNDIDTGPLRELHADDTEATRLVGPLLFRLIKSLRDDLRPEHSFRMHKDLPIGGIPMLGYDTTNPMKRFAQLGKARPQPGKARPQPRWKSKKGRAIGSQMVCYFKLCAFRSPA